MNEIVMIFKGFQNINGVIFLMSQLIGIMIFQTVGFTHYEMGRRKLFDEGATIKTIKHKATTLTTCNLIGKLSIALVMLIPTPDLIKTLLRVVLFSLSIFNVIYSYWLWMVSRRFYRHVRLQ